VRTADELTLRFECDKFPVASLFIRADVRAGEATFLEDFLASLFHQLGGHSSLDAYQAYQEACDQSKRVAIRISSIREAVNARLSDLPRAFLLLDDVDRCDGALRLLLDAELASLQKHGLSVMVTSRLPIFEEPEVITCDVHPSEELKIFWECRVCGFIVCSAGKEEMDSCERW
jgi:hypothetical protein